jgi:hypothetical protein
MKKKLSIDLFIQKNGSQLIGIQVTNLLKQKMRKNISKCAILENLYEKDISTISNFKYY